MYFYFLEDSLYCFSWSLYQFLPLPIAHKDSLFSTSSPTPIMFFNDIYPNRCEVVSHFGLDSQGPDYEWCLTPFHVHVGHFMPYENVCSDPLLGFKWSIWTFCCRVAWVWDILILKINAVSDIGKCNFPFCRHPFHCIYYFLSCTKAF